MSRDEANKNLVRLEKQLKNDPVRFDNDMRTVKSYIDDMHELEENRKTRN